MNQVPRIQEDAMTRFRAFAVTAILAGLLAGGVAFAQGAGPGRPGPGRFGRGGPGGPGGLAGLPLRALNLTQAQQDQIKQLVDQDRAQNRTVGQQLRTAMDAQRKAVETIPFDEGLIRSTTQALVDAQTNMAIHQARLQGEIFALLSPAQQEQVKTFRAEREARGQQQRQRGDKQPPQR
jgi:Spy/CpxP family protein refolding chaperone